MGATQDRCPRFRLLMASIVIGILSVSPDAAQAQKTSAPAQPVQAAPNPQGGPAATASVSIAKGAPHGRLNSLPVGAAKSRITMDFRDAPIDQILNFFSIVSGLTVIKDPDFQGTATIISPRPIPISAALDILGALVDSRGYRLDRAPHMMRISPKGSGGGGSPGFGGPGAGGPGVKGPGVAGPGAGGPGTGGSGGAGGAGFGGRGFGGAGRSRDQTQVFQLHYASAKSVTSIVNDLFKNAAGGGGGAGSNPPADAAAGGTARPAPSTARASTDDYSNSVIVTGPADQLTQIGDMIDQIDQPVGNTQITQVFRIRYIDAQSVSSVVSNVLLASSKNGAAGGASGGVPQDQRAFMSARFGASAATNGQVVVLPETNSLVVTASAESLDLIKQVLGELDQPQKIESTTFVRNLKNASAADVAQLLNQMYGRQGRTGATGTTGINSGTRTNTGFGANTGLGSGTQRNGNTGLGAGSRGGSSLGGSILGG